MEVILTIAALSRYDSPWIVGKGMLVLASLVASERYRRLLLAVNIVGCLYRPCDLEVPLLILAATVPRDVHNPDPLWLACFTATLSLWYMWNPDFQHLVLPCLAALYAAAASCLWSASWYRWRFLLICVVVWYDSLSGLACGAPPPRNLSLASACDEAVSTAAP